MPLHESNFRTKHKNELWDALLNPGLDDPEDPVPLPVEDFEWLGLAEENGFWEATVRHMPTQSAFVIGWSGQFSPEGSISITYAPHPVRPSIDTMVKNWPSAVMHFRRWLRALAEESIPDIWEAARTKTVIERAFTSDYDSDFTPLEVERIGESFRHALHDVRDQGLLSSADLQHLADVLKREAARAQVTPRIQWQSVAATAVVTKLIERGLDKITIDAVMSAIAATLSWLNVHMVESFHKVVLLLSRGT